ncbi:hypothetical protein RJ640_019495 [Escallonia rubra]|uniref:Uncharacterized protein n=1 Tax=Escallonia rubra TaxID=112253 RepID=A0AA88RVR2_9ASTE|nr:hypothetical protein RJ640_019495 [Escallonia rubra]
MGGSSTRHYTPQPQPQPQPQAPKKPHNCEVILKDADIPPIDWSSVEKLPDQLYAGVFLNQKRKKYWVDRTSHHNCFMVFARDLAITWADDERFWQWAIFKETSDAFVEVAELLNVCWLEIRGRFETTKLSPGIVYEVFFVVMLKDHAYGWEVPVQFKLILPDDSSQEHKENFMNKQKGQWIEILAGKFMATPDKVGDIEFSLCGCEGRNWKKGLVVKGVAIRPEA